jgi:hypothetical protein
MKSKGYKFISNREPTYKELNAIMNAAFSGIKKANDEADKKALKQQQENFVKVKKKFSIAIKQYAPKA